jgi:choline dehydrogenase-like flavoprotein
MAAVFDLSDDSVVVVVGSGAGGGTLSNELAQKGVNVVCLEAGPRLTLADIVNDFGVMFSRLSWLDKRVGTGDLDPNLPLWVCKTVGGTTVHWAGASLRFQDHEWKARTTYGDLAGASLADWPIDGAEMARYYDQAEEKIGVAGTGNRPRLPGNNNYKVLAYGAKVLGYEKVHTGNMGINSIERDGRPACHQLGFCMAGCAIGAKWSTLYTEIPKAEATGHFKLRPECMALQIQHNGSGKVTGVLYADKDGTQHLQKARAVCVAGNSVESPRLLLNSASSKYPDGLANSSGQVGRNFMRHTTGAVYGIMPGPVHLDRGTQMAGIIMDEARFDPTRGFAGGYEMETLPGSPASRRTCTQAPGAGSTPRTSSSTATSPACGSSARTCRRRRTASRCIRPKRISTACRSRSCTSAITRTTLPCAITRSRRAATFIGRPGRPTSTNGCRSPARTTWAPAG